VCLFKNANKSGVANLDNVIIRPAMQSDAEQIMKHTKKILGENQNVFGTALEEFNVSVEDEEKWIASHEERGFLLVAEIDGLIIGVINFKLSSSKKFSHNGYFGMSVQEKYTGNGIGSSLLNQLLQLAVADKKVEKVYLEVFANNKRAISLYKKFGFIEEGRKKNHVKHRLNEYEDEILMSKFV
jgi:RimJ/RimL family protein N-acetyltransferase